MLFRSIENPGCYFISFNLYIPYNNTSAVYTTFTFRVNDQIVPGTDVLIRQYQLEHACLPVTIQASVNITTANSTFAVYSANSMSVSSIVSSPTISTLNIFSLALST